MEDELAAAALISSALSMANCLDPGEFSRALDAAIPVLPLCKMEDMADMIDRPGEFGATAGMGPPPRVLETPENIPEPGVPRRPPIEPNNEDDTVGTALAGCQSQFCTSSGGRSE